MTQKKLYRAEANVRVQLNPELRGFAEYIYREPHYNYNSIFWVFNYSKNQEVASGQLGITYRPMPQFSVDIQGQFLINRIYKSDARILAGFSYWLFKKL